MRLVDSNGIKTLHGGLSTKGQKSPSEQPEKPCKTKTPDRFVISEDDEDNVLNEYGGYNSEPSDSDIKRVDIIWFSVDEPDQDTIDEYLDGRSDFSSNIEKVQFFRENTTYDLECKDSDWNDLFTSYGITYDEIQEMFGDMIADSISTKHGCRQVSSSEWELRDILDMSIGDDVNPDNVDEVNEVAKRYFGEGSYYGGGEGYILTDGSFCDFGSHRDHQSITCLAKGMTVGKFVSLGNIRIRGNNINLEKMPTSEQRTEIMRFCRYYSDGEVYLDISRYDENALRKSMYADEVYSARYVNPKFYEVWNAIEKHCVDD